MQGWKDKPVWDKFVSTVSVPTIFLLVTTLPVVEMESHDDSSSEASVADPPRLDEPGDAAPPMSVEPNASLEPEAEWQRYRRSPRPSSPSGSLLPFPVLRLVDAESHNGHSGIPIFEMQGPAGTSQGKPSSSVQLDDQASSSDGPTGWNRWLVALQIFMGPLFTVFIVWANTRDGVDQP
ncbi:MAG: hypothetical protein OK454_08720, partial [Thaumarchaeota archaeon]|nr:hypothetical protein [Nitrososphaerota archaeon]